MDDWRNQQWHGSPVSIGVRKVLLYWRFMSDATAADASAGEVTTAAAAVTATAAAVCEFIHWS